MKENITEVLTEDLDEELLKRMPLWFRILREAYTRGTRQNFAERSV